MATLEEAEQIMAQLREELKEAKERIKFLEDVVEKLRKELRGYHNENTPSGAVPPYLKQTVEIRREFVKAERQEKAEDNVKKNNIRNQRPRKVDRIECHELKKCPCCGGEVKKKRVKPAERIIFTLNLPTVETVKHIKPRYYCPDCKKEVLPKIENEIPNTKFDLTTFIFISVLSTGSNMSLGSIAELFSFFGLDISKATLSNYLKKFKDYLKDDYQKLQEKILNAKAKCKDETSHRHNGKLNWTWVAATTTEVCYWIEKGRDYKTAKRIFKGDKGIDTVDGYRAYDQLGKPIQRDWAHALRIARNPEYWFTSEEEVTEHKAFVRHLQKLYHSAKEDRRKSGSSQELKRKYEQKLFTLLSSVKNPGKNATKLINYMMHYNLDWFTFLEHEGVEPTSNRAERALRHIVIKRKISQQTRSDESKCKQRSNFPHFQR